MARTMNALSARKVETVAKPGRYRDGGNLFLSVSANGGKRWVFLYTIAGQRREMGLGSAHAGQVTLAQARERAAVARDDLLKGDDPIKARDAREAAKKALEGGSKTFGEYAAEYIKTHREGWRNPKHKAQWESTIAKHCVSILDKPVKAIDTETVLSVLKPIWQELPETASRLRGRIERILFAAMAKEKIEGLNPARWRGNLDIYLAQPQKLLRGHHAALPFTKVPAFMAELRAREAIAALALEFTILTATRSGEVLKARWQELDLEAAIWTIPATRMKAGKEHRIPLSPRAVAIVKALPRIEGQEYLFPGHKQGAAMSSMAMAMLLRRMGHETITVHGFRSAFRDWAAETTNFPHDVCEMALAHTIKDKSEAAYRRGDLFGKRRKLMEAWASFAETRAGGNVVPMGQKVKA
jgi:integrase